MWVNFYNGTDEPAASRAPEVAMGVLRGGKVPLPMWLARGGEESNDSASEFSEFSEFSENSEAARCRSQCGWRLNRLLAIG